LRVACISGPGRITVENVADPRPAAADAVVKVRHATICGSDLTILAGKMAGVGYPLVPGHEWVGEVIETAPEHHHLRGRIVVSDLLEHCGGCTFCSRGQPNLCDHLVEPGLTRPGAFAEYVAVRASNLLVLPDEIPLRQAALIEPLAVALYALERVPVSEGETVAIFGGGGIGQLIARCCLAAGAHVGLADPHPHRRASATAHGCTALPAGDELPAAWLDAGLFPPDVVFEASGDPAGLHLAVDLAAKGGRIGLVGYGGTRRVHLMPSKIMSKALSISGVLSPTGTWHAAISNVRTGRISLAGLLTHEFPLERTAEAFACAAERADGAIRVGIAP